MSTYQRLHRCLLHACSVYPACFYENHTLSLAIGYRRERLKKATRNFALRKGDSNTSHVAGDPIMRLLYIRGDKILFGQYSRRCRQS